ncbi:conserved exported hypothetical protein [Flavobacterium sp. 9AF]|uniref:hypothetical protein n=1 Tax=Flavobacterium sp. 9AF TaxID=2653142 RepID=UPI0012F429A4|nr:hypothetical protein [Flavobacterium sp. 9AF]VXB21372.1 conserved exported hypothetical protein [Flavobacterium sp. 9AF]
MKLKYSYITFCLFFLLFFVSATEQGISFAKNEKFTCLTSQKQFIAGKPIILEFTNNHYKQMQLVVLHSYGKTLVNGIATNNKIQFALPKNYYNKTGLVSWFLLIGKEEKAKGTFQILPNDQSSTQLETYLGPPSTLVGDGHFVMFVTIPTDILDNPKLPNTEVTIKDQFLSNIRSENTKTKDFIAWKNIYSPTKSGIVLISANCNETQTKEFDAVIYPSIATDFIISAKRNHEFADGNQITQLITSEIKDKFGNTVSDGTFVSFLITTNEGAILRTFGTTLNGSAKGEILHPDKDDSYRITAFVNGICQSNTIQLNYKPINPSVSYSLSKGNRIIEVGPIKSFMNQLVPDGIKVSLRIYHKNKLIDTLIENSLKGKVRFKLSPDFYPEKEYQFEIETLGRTIKTSEIHVANK